MLSAVAASTRTTQSVRRRKFGAVGTGGGGLGKRGAGQGPLGISDKFQVKEVLQASVFVDVGGQGEGGLWSRRLVN